MTGDHPGESTAATRETLEKTADVSELRGNAGSEEDEKGTNPGEHQPDETQSVPENELAMDIGQGAVGVLDSFDELFSSIRCTVEAGVVGVGESVDSEGDAESNVHGDDGERQQAA